MRFLATNDIPGLRRLLLVALNRGASPRAVLVQLQQSFLGFYSPRGGFSERDLEISYLVKALGGPRLLYALHKSHGLASVSTVGRHRVVPRLLTSIGTPSMEEIYDNITVFHAPEQKPPPEPSANGSLPGHILMLDGVAIEEKCRYDSTRNAVVGLCREHGGRVNTSVSSVENLERIAEALDRGPEDGGCCHGKDATVVAIGPYARADHYTPTPIALSASCKAEDAVSLARWLAMVLEVWESHPQGKKLHGPLWSVGSDGESQFRKARHILCMIQEIDPNSVLGQKLRSCLGLNKMTSCHGVVATCDPKHILKSKCFYLVEFQATNVSY